MGHTVRKSPVQLKLPLKTCQFNVVHTESPPRPQTNTGMCLDISSMSDMCLIVLAASPCLLSVCLSVIRVVACMVWMCALDAVVDDHFMHVCDDMTVFR